MSLPLSELLTALGNNKQIKPTEGTLYNPDIPERLDETEEIMDQYSSMKINTPFNGSGLPLRESGVLSRMDPKKRDFSTDGAIDPNIIRSKIDPDSAMPSLNRYSKFSLMPSSTAEPHSQVDLIRKSRESFTNYQNRLSSATPQATQNQPINSQNAIRKPPSYLEPRSEFKPDAPPPLYENPEPTYDVINQDAMIPHDLIIAKPKKPDPNDTSTWPLFGEDVPK
jgi:hypothetical protein